MARLAPEAEGEPGGLAELRTLLDTISLVKTYHVDPVDSLDLIGAYLKTGSINGMLEEALADPYNHYLAADAYARMQDDLTGSFGGIGIMVGLRDSRLTVIAPIEGTPGFAAGLRGGDHISAVDDRQTENMSLNEAVSLMRGEPGTQVRLQIERSVRDQVEAFDVEIVRAIIENHSVTRKSIIEPSDDFPFLTGRIAYIRLADFSGRTDVQLVEAYNEVVRNRNVDGLVLDMRNNGGGLFPAAIAVANRFVPEGPLVHVVARDGERQTSFADPRLALKDVPPMVVLVNEFSASGTEIVAGALQDSGTAVLVGETTFGKGLVQTVIGLREGALVLTTARYQTASGRFIDQQGIEPDEVVEWSVEEQQEAEYDREPGLAGISPADPQLRRALEMLQDHIVAAALPEAS